MQAWVVLFMTALWWTGCQAQLACDWQMAIRASPLVLWDPTTIQVKRHRRKSSRSWRRGCQSTYNVILTYPPWCFLIVMGLTDSIQSLIHSQHFLKVYKSSFIKLLKCNSKHLFNKSSDHSWTLCYRNKKIGAPHIEYTSIFSNFLTGYGLTWGVSVKLISL